MATTATPPTKHAPTMNRGDADGINGYAAVAFHCGLLKRMAGCVYLT